MPELQIAFFGAVETSGAHMVAAVMIWIIVKFEASLKHIALIKETS